MTTSGGKRSSTAKRKRCSRSTWGRSSTPRRTPASCSRRSRSVSPGSGTSSCEENPVRLTEARISHLSHRLRTALLKAGLADFPDDSAAHREAKAVFESYVKVEGDGDAFGREEISRLPRRGLEGGWARVS